MNNPVLTIAIPTYNRPAQLNKTLGIILPQVVKDRRVCLLILDNHSEVPAAEILNSFGIAIQSDRIRVVRNFVNIGANANIMRCFELCETSWLWVLGDDDDPSPDAVKTILQDVHIDPCFVFYTVPKIKKPVFNVSDPDHVSGNDFKALVSHFGANKLEIAFLSAALFNMDAIRPYIIDGYLAANTGLPHLIMVFKALAQGHQWVLSRNVIADYCPPEEGKGWGFMTFVFTMPSLLGLASTNSEVRVIKEIMIKGWRPSPKKILYSLANKYAGNSGGSDEIRYLFRTIKNIYAPLWAEDAMLRLRWNISCILAFFPKSFSEKYKKRKIGKARINLENEARR
jgi:glycosyltransferase involved in cell wall biosynthesis